eukprot:augustus_masked-scaffold_3-processed-gene-3.66-mRNA-1 protein AED:0.05 eAED:0.08 QI:0/-1/0/1/-1/1/1/0/339
MKYVELFCGVGGFRLGLEKYGTCVWACDVDPDARLMYKANFGAFPYSDITKVKLDGNKFIPDFDLLTAGFPCQDFSRLGDQTGLTGKKGILFFEVIKFAKHFKPKVLLLENVKGLLESNEGKDLKLVISELDALGYHVQYRQINSNNFLPQFRNRIYFVCVRQDIASNSNASFPDLLLPRFAGSVSDTLETEKENSFLPYYVLSKERYNNLKRSKIVKKAGLTKRICFADDDFADTLISSYYVSTKSNAQYVAFETSSSGSRNLKQAEYIRAKEVDDNSVCLRPRYFTPVEMLRLMGFPDSFKCHPNDKVLAKLLGNAVTPPVIEYIYKEYISTFLEQR